MCPLASRSELEVGRGVICLYTGAVIIVCLVVQFWLFKELRYGLQCKHQLAARLAESLQCCQTVCVPDEVLAQLLIAT